MRITGILLIALLIINAAAVWGIFSERRSSEILALQDLQLQTTAHARALEAMLASLRGDFVFLSRTPPIADALSALSSSDALTRRWSRLDIEGSLLLFLDAHPEVRQIVIRESGAKAVVAAGRREGAPVLLPPEQVHAADDSAEGQIVGAWPLAAGGNGGGTLESLTEVSDLVRAAVPGIDQRFSLVQGQEAWPVPVSRESRDELVVSSPVHDAGWAEPIRWTLVCRDRQSRLVQSVGALATRYRTTVVLNLIVMSLALVLGFIGIRHVRRSTTLEAENRQQERFRELERQVHHSERLASVGRLAAGMAHEINNPLEGMSNYLSLLEADLRSGRSREALTWVERVREGLDRAAGVVRHVLMFSEPGFGGHEPVELGEVLRETVEFVASSPAWSGIHIRCETGHHPILVMANRVKLGQLVLNLILNAEQVQQSRGWIRIAAVSAGNNAVIEVEDGGPGIPEEVLPKLFEPFFSTRGSTGLGLSICHGIAVEHHGQIRAENLPGGGAIFRVQIPLHPAQTPGNAAESETEVQTA